LAKKKRAEGDQRRSWHTISGPTNPAHTFPWAEGARPVYRSFLPMSRNANPISFAPSHPRDRGCSRQNRPNREKFLALSVSPRAREAGPAPPELRGFVGCLGAQIPQDFLNFKIADQPQAGKGRLPARGGAAISADRKRLIGRADRRPTPAHCAAGTGPIALFCKRLEP